MPTYEYACLSCGRHVEVFQRFSDAPLTECGICGGPLRKVFHPAGILFKGSGFYSTDSRRAGSKHAGGDGSKPETAGSRSDTGGSPSETGESTSGSGAAASPATPSPSTASKEKTA